MGEGTGKRRWKGRTGGNGRGGKGRGKRGEGKEGGGKEREREGGIPSE